MHLHLVVIYISNLLKRNNLKELYSNFTWNISQDLHGWPAVYCSNILGTSFRKIARPVALDWSSCNYNIISTLCHFLNYVYICELTTEIQVCGPAVTLHL